MQTASWSRGLSRVAIGVLALLLAVLTEGQAPQAPAREAGGHSVVQANKARTDALPRPASVQRDAAHPLARP